MCRPLVSRTMPYRLVTVALLVASLADGQAAAWNFVSIPDFLNADVDFPQPGWEEALSFTLSAVKDEDPAFVLVAGDMVNGRWWRSAAQIEYMADRYYSAWKRRMKQHGLDIYYVAIGDHEVGDNPWLPNGGPFKRQAWNGTWDCAPLEFLPNYEKAFLKHFAMPTNGPSDKLGTAYFVRHKNVLLVTLNVFDQQLLAEHGEADVTQTQLEWLEQTLKSHSDVQFKIVQGHTPILGPVRREHSSGMMLRGGADSELWKVMTRNRVDLYLCGEVHAITCTERDGVMQVAHGSIFGWNSHANYLVAEVDSDRVRLTLKEIDLVNGGAYLPQSAANEPREIVRVAERSKERGFVAVGSVTLRNVAGGNRFENPTGYFAQPPVGNED